MDIVAGSVSDQIQSFHVTVAELIAQRRGELGLSQGELAELVGTSRSRLNTYERAHVFPTSDTLERVFDAMGCELSVTPALTYEERRSLAISSAVAAKLLADPQPVLVHAASNLERMRLAASHESDWIETWASLLRLGERYVAMLLTSTDQFCRDLRQSSPFAGVLTVDERAQAVEGLRR
jgi:transcriptional regulator with XRE-family HTH domain